MPRIMEIIMFVTPFIGFVAWRLFFPSPKPPGWLLCGMAVFVLLMLAGLFWMRQQDAADAGRAYVPATLQDGRIVPGHAEPRR